MNEQQRKLICWSPHAIDVSSPHANEFLVCSSSSLRLFRSDPAGSSRRQHNNHPNDALQRQTSSSSSSSSSSTLSNEPHHRQSRHGTTTTKWSVDIRTNAQQDAQSLTPSSSFSLLDSIAPPSGLSLKCIGWSHSPSNAYMIGGGQMSGKLVLMKFAPSGSSNGSSSYVSGSNDGSGNNDNSSSSRILKEFNPRYARACHVVSWNPAHTNQIAVGLDRVRNGCGTLIWDVEQRGTFLGSGAAPTAAIVQQGMNNSTFVNGDRGDRRDGGGLNAASAAAPSSSSGVETVLEPLGRVSNSEATLSLRWLPHDPYSLAVGTGFKWLRIYDIRGSSRPTSVVAHSKSVNGVQFDPFNPVRLSTFTEEGSIKIWDLRMLTRKELFCIHSSGAPSAAEKSSAGSTASTTSATIGRAPKLLLEVEWCPTAANRLATIHRDEDSFRVWDLSGSVPVQLPGGAMSGNNSTNAMNGGGGGDDVVNYANYDGYDNMPRLSPQSSSLAMIASSSSESNIGSGSNDAPASSTDNVPFRTVRLACLSTPFIPSSNNVVHQHGHNPMMNGTPSFPHYVQSHLQSIVPQQHIQQSVTPANSIHSLSWHPGMKHRLLVITSHGLVEDMPLHDSIPLAWNASQNSICIAVNDAIMIGDDGSAQRGKRDPMDMIAPPSSSFSPAGSIDPTLFLSQDISTRMRVRATLGYGLDLDRNRRVTSKLILALRSTCGPLPSGGSLAGGAGSGSGAGTGRTAVPGGLPGGMDIDQMMLSEALRDEESLARAWEWMIQSERRAQRSSSSASSSDQSASARAGSSARFAGILSILLPAVSTHTMNAHVAALARKPRDAASSAAGSTLLSFMQNDGVGDSSSGGGSNLAAPTLAAPLAPLTLTPASRSCTSTVALGYLPSGFKIFLSAQRSAALQLCHGWFDIFATNDLGELQPSESAAAAAGGRGNSGGSSRSISGEVDASSAPPSSSASAQHAHVAAQRVLYESHLSSLENQGCYEKAAMLAVFHMDLERALRSLTLGAQRAHALPGPTSSATAPGTSSGARDLGLVAMALSGYANFASHARSSSSASGALDNSSMNHLWSHTWSSALGGVGAGGGDAPSSALQSVFAFLSAFAPPQPTAKTYTDVLKGVGSESASSSSSSSSTSSSSSRASQSKDSIGGRGGLEFIDTLGFILRFLPDEELVTYILDLTRRYVTLGNLDAIMITGLSHYEAASGSGASSGSGSASGGAMPAVSYTLELLQCYLDRTSDVQTASILGCFAGVSINVAPSTALASSASSAASSSIVSSPLQSSPSPSLELSDPSSCLSQWTYFYRTLLNQWGMWSERAKYDCARALIEKNWMDEEQARIAAASNSGGGHRASSAIQPLRKPSHHTAGAPRAQISVRCNFCGQNLSLDAMNNAQGTGAGGNVAASTGPGNRGGSGAGVGRPRGRIGVKGLPTDMNSARSRGCPHCKKSLPRCSLCLVSFDCDTPQHATAPNSRRLKKQTKSEGQEEDIVIGGANTNMHVEDDARFDSGSMHEFGKWFTWCQACRHGGHADHIADWFHSHRECPVTDCDCRCMSRDLLPPSSSSSSSSISTANNDHYNSHQSHQHHQQQQHRLYDNQTSSMSSYPPQSSFNHHQSANSQSFSPMHNNEQTLAMQQIQSAYPSGMLPLDVIAVAQAIQLMNITRGTSGNTNSPTMTVSSSSSSSSSMMPSSTPSHHSTPHVMPNQQQNYNNIPSIDQQSSSAQSVRSTNNAMTNQQHQNQQQRAATNNQPPVRSFPLTTW